MINQVFLDPSSPWVVTGSVEFDTSSAHLKMPQGTSFPTSPETGDYFYKTDTNIAYRYNGATWDAVTAVPGAHAASHQGGGDALTVDAAAGTGSFRTIGTGTLQACAGNDTRLSDARTPIAHAASHQGGGDALTVDAAAGTGSFRTIGTGALQACAGNDSRLSDSRTPTAHASSHQAGGGGDPIKLDDLAAPDDTTDLNATTEKHGLLLKLGGGTTNFLRGDGSWAAPTATPAVHANEVHDPDMLTVGSNRSDTNLDILTDGDQDDDVDALHLHVRKDKSKAYLWEDFVGNGTYGYLWAVTLSGTGSAGGVDSNGIGGLFKLTSGGAVDRYAILTAGTKFNWSHAKKANMIFRYGIADLADSHCWVGLRYTDSERSMFYRSGTGNWFAYTTAGGVSTSTDTGIASDTSYHTFEIVCSASSVVFKIDGVTKATHATNLSSSQMEPTFIQRTTGGSATRVSNVDYVEIIGDRA
jgi:hypothetical protein